MFTELVYFSYLSNPYEFWESYKTYKSIFINVWNQ